jgi:hypothetical protein
MIWNLVYWVLLVLAIGVGLRGLFWDRAGFRGRAALRCRKCWYDLTGSPGDIKDGPIVCSECGKKHESRRALRKTRRSRRAFMVMMLVLLLAYGAVAMPRVQRHGWAGLVPETVLVLTMPILSDKPGSAMSFLNTGLSASAYEEFVLDRFSADHGALGGRPEGLGWVNRRLVFWFAKRQSTAAVTDSSAARGNVFRSMISMMIRNGTAMAGEVEWANSVVHIEFDQAGPVAMNEVAYSGFKARRLKGGAYRLMIGQSNALYSGYTPNARAFRPRGRGAPTNEDRIEHFQWDSSYKIAHTGGVIHNSEVVALGRPYKAGDQIGKINVRVVILENEARRINGEQWVVAGDAHKEVTLSIDETLKIPTDASEEVGEELMRSLRAKLTVEHDRGNGAWVPVIKLESVFGSRVLAYDSVLFGGEVSVVMYSMRKGQEEVLSARGIPVLSGGMQVWSLPSIGRLESQRLEPNRILGQVEYAGFSLPNSGYLSYEFRVRINPQRVITFGDYGGLAGDVMYPFAIEFSLEDWTGEELTQYIVNGTVPDHAMP